MSTMVSFREVSKSFPGRQHTVTAVDQVSLDVERGEIFGIIGYSGAGKSTLVRLVNALEKPTSGSVVVDGQEVSALSEAQLRPVRAKIGMIFQQFNLFSSRNVADNVGYPLELAGWPKKKRQARVAELLDFVGIGDRARAYPAQLSGGQKQRVGIARALATSPDVLLADEATSALDPETTRDVLELLRRVNRELGITILLITHEMDVIRFICDRVAVMDAGRVVEQGSVYDVFSNPQTATAQRFVGTVLRDRPSAEAVARLRAAHPGRLVTIAVDEEHHAGPVLSRIVHEHGVTFEVVYGGISELQERSVGSLTIELTGDAAAVEAAVADLRLTGDVQDLTISDDAEEVSK